MRQKIESTRIKKLKKNGLKTPIDQRN